MAAPQHIELAAISQRGGLREVRSTSVSGNNPGSEAFPGGAKAAMSNRSKNLLFDHLIGKQEEGIRQLESHRFRGLEVDY
jgi:hypothetical protein